MRFRDFIWPNNPRTYSIEFQREIVPRKLAQGTYYLQNMGLRNRIMQGEGEFFGPRAYSDFKRLSCLFYEDKPGVLVHPEWMATNVYFVRLSLLQEPREDYVRYSFTFWENLSSGTAKLQGTGALAPDGGAGAKPVRTGAVYHRVKKGESLWGIAGRYQTTVSAILKLNSGIKNQNLIYPGQEVRVS
ncbi:MAG: LysM peptidoglycan-binding domain-containing protein [Oscillospiraceae bacterium]